MLAMRSFQLLAAAFILALSALVAGECQAQTVEERWAEIRIPETTELQRIEARMDKARELDSQRQVSDTDTRKGWEVLRDEVTKLDTLIDLRKAYDTKISQLSESQSPAQEATEWARLEFIAASFGETSDFVNALSSIAAFFANAERYREAVFVYKLVIPRAERLQTWDSVGHAHFRLAEVYEAMGLEQDAARESAIGKRIFDEALGRSRKR